MIALCIFRYFIQLPENIIFEIDSHLYPDPLGLWVDKHDFSFQIGIFHVTSSKKLGLHKAPCVEMLCKALLRPEALCKTPPISGVEKAKMCQCVWSKAMWSPSKPVWGFMKLHHISVGKRLKCAYLYINALLYGPSKVLMGFIEHPLYLWSLCIGALQSPSVGVFVKHPPICRKRLKCAYVCMCVYNA